MLIPEDVGIASRKPDIDPRWHSGVTGVTDRQIDGFSALYSIYVYIYMYNNYMFIKFIL